MADNNNTSSAGSSDSTNSSSVTVLAGVFANTLRELAQRFPEQSTSRSANQSNMAVQSTSTSTSRSQSGHLPRSLGVSATGAGGTGLSSSFERASTFKPSKRPFFSPPTMFENVRTRCKKKKVGNIKTTFYNRDVILLPQEFQSSTGEITIPRSSNRTLLGQAGRKLAWLVKLSFRRQ